MAIKKQVCKVVLTDNKLKRFLEDPVLKQINNAEKKLLKNFKPEQILLNEDGETDYIFQDHIGGQLEVLRLQRKTYIGKLYKNECRLTGELK